MADYMIMTKFVTRCEKPIKNWISLFGKLRYEYYGSNGT